MMHEMMRSCCGKDGSPDLEKMTRFMERHDDASKLDTVGWGLFFIWVGVAWLMDLGLAIGLLGVAVITLGVQLVRKFRGFPVEIFWIVVGGALGVGGLWEFYDIETPLAPIVLVIAGIAILAWRFSRHRSV